MNEIALSDDLKIIELEINHHKNIAGQSIWEIGRRLNHVKENDLAHGEFMQWVESNLKMDIREAQRFMKVASELPNTDTWSHLGGRALYLISTLPEEERTKEHVTEKGETKTPDEMTVRELQKLNQRLKQQSEIIENKNSVIAKQSEELGKLRKQEPQIVEKIPDDYAGLQESHSYLTDRLLKAEQDLKIANSKYDLLKSSTAEAKELKKQIDSLKGEQNSLMQAIDATKDLHQLEQDFNDFFDKHMAPMKFKGINQYLTATSAPDRIYALIDLAQAWVDEMQRLVPKNRKIIEGEFEDE